MLDDAAKAVYADSPWTVLLESWGCKRKQGQRIAPCPCVWRRPPTGPVPWVLEKELRWDWRSAKKERGVRLALQHREQIREGPYGGIVP